MYKNYFFLNRIVLEANTILKDFIFNSIFTQEKDKLIIQCRKDSAEKFIEISVEPGSPYFTIKDEYHRAKKNTIDFFSDYVPSKLHNIEISTTDRVIKLSLDSFNIFFTIRGKYSNLILLGSKGEAEYFKNMPEDFKEDEFVNEMHLSEFSDSFNIPLLQVDDKSDIWFEVKNKYPFIGKEILMEAKYRCKSESYEDIIRTVKNIITEFKTSKPAVISGEGTNQVHIGFDSLHVFPGSQVKVFDDVIPAFNYYLSKYHYTEEAERLKKIIRKHLGKEIQKLSSKLNFTKAAIDRGSKEAELKKFGELLLININSIVSGKEFIEVPDIFTNNNIIKIKLDPSLSPQKNIDKYFDNAKNEKIRLEKSIELYEISSRQFNNYKSIEEKLSNAASIEDYNHLMKELKIKETQSSTKTEDISSKFKHYLIDGKYNVYVGKDSKTNDLLTTKFAKQNDYWFHARRVPGSHLVLRVENTKEAVPKSVLTKAAALAAYHSKAKTSGLAPVSYSQKKYVVKKKGMDPGEVAMMKEDVLLVKPEIPKGCEYLSND